MKRGSNPLSRERVLLAALQVVDTEGTDGLTMRRLGTELGVDPMMVYRYVPGKAALFDGIAETIWASVNFASSGEASGWQEELILVMHQLRSALLAHPRAVVILGTRPVAGEQFFALLERLLERLTRAGLPADADTAELLNVLVLYTIGHVLSEAGDPVGGEADEHSHLGVLPSLYPNLAAVFNSGWQYNADRQFTRGLHATVTGWETDRLGEEAGQ